MLAIIILVPLVLLALFGAFSLFWSWLGVVVAVQDQQRRDALDAQWAAQKRAWEAARANEGHPQ